MSSTRTVPDIDDVDFGPSPQAPLRARIVAAAAHLTTTVGWNAVTMARLADLVGVSRQTVYNEIGGKPALADAMVQAELAEFLAVVNTGFHHHPDDLLAALRETVERVLTAARDDTLLQAVVSATHGAESDLLPLLTSRSETLLATAKGVVLALVGGYDVPLTDQQTAAAVDVIVRTVLSHIVAPSAEPAEVADAIALLVGAVLGDS